jgi:hypothetical protein
MELRLSVTAITFAVQVTKIKLKRWAAAPPLGEVNGPRPQVRRPRTWGSPFVVVRYQFFEHL